MICTDALTFVGGCLSSAGFVPKIEYLGDIREEPSGTTDYYPAFMRVTKESLDQFKGGSASECRAEVTVKVRMLGSAKGFADADVLANMCENAAGRAYMSSDMIVKKTELGEFRRNITLGRLEREMTFTVSYIVTLTEVIR